MKKRKEVLHDLTRSVPSGVGRGHKIKLDFKELDAILTKGAKWAVEKQTPFLFCGYRQAHFR